MKRSGGGSWSSSSPAAAAPGCSPAAEGLPQRERGTALRRGGSRPKCPGRSELGERGRAAGCQAAAGSVPSGRGGQALPGAQHCAEGKELQRRPRVCSAPRCVCVCVCACTRLTAPWLREQPRLRATALATAPRPELPAGGSCQRGRWRPGSALKRRERGKGRRAGGRRGRLCSLALRQSVLLVSPEAKSWRFGGEPLRLPGCPVALRGSSTGGVSSGA